MKAIRIGCFLLAAALAMGADQHPNLSGNWQLSVAKSHWGSKPKPISVVLVIEHNDPAFKYHGTVTQTSENTRDFTFDGAIDGKEYPIEGSAGAGKAVLKWVNASTMESEYRSADGKSSETTRTTVSKDGKQLTRSIQEKTPQGSKSWSEVYDRK